jgi:SAM-dependent methyltransferase
MLDNVTAPRRRMSESGGAEISAYYDRLSRWTRIAGLVGYGGGRASLSVHRALADPLAGGRATPTRVNDLVESRVRSTWPARRDLRVLDAGCGLGGVMLDLVHRLGGTAVGLTLSPSQAQDARRAAARAGLSAQVTVLVQTYDEPPPGPFDVVVAVESLAHSPDPNRSLRALAARVAPAGLLMVVDDMPETGVVESDDLTRFKSGWRCPVLWGAAQYRAALLDLGLVSEVEDLTEACRPRELAAIERLERWNRLARTLVPLQAWRAVLASHAGGLALERLYRRRLMRYCLIAARRPAASGATPS